MILQKDIRLDFVLDYCVFSGQPVYIYPSNNPDKKAIFIILDSTLKTFKAKLASSQSVEEILDSFLNKELIVYTKYLSRSLTFNSKLFPFAILNNSESMRIRELHGKRLFVFEKLLKGELKNVRPNMRFSLVSEGQHLKAELTVVSQVGTYHFVTENLFDISLETVALFLDRSKGLILPGDEVENLIIYRNGKPVVETKGQVVRCDLFQKSNQIENLYFVAIRFYEPSPQKQATFQIQRTQRLSFLEEQSAFVDGQHSFLEGFHIYGCIRDISPLGLSFDVKKTSAPIVPGTIFDEFFIQLPHQRGFEVSIRVTYVKILKDKKYIYRIGAAFIRFSNEFLKAISQIKQRYLDKRFVDASFEDYESLWLFFFESKFIYRQKREQIQDYADKIRCTYFKVLKKSSPVIKQILFKEEDEIKGFIAALKIFDHAWMVQHLQGRITLDQTNSGTVVMQAMIDFFLEPEANKRVKTDFVTCFYRPENIFPSVVFGEATKRLGNSKICNTRDYRFCLVNTNNMEEVFFSSKIQVSECREADQSDLKKLEALLVSQGEFSTLRIEGLNFENAVNLKISKDFLDMGLYRYRKVFMTSVLQEDAVVYAVCDFSSPGLNFSELTNVIKLFYSNPQSELNSVLANQICKYVLDAYGQTEMPTPVLLLSENQPLPIQFIKKKIYRYWFLDARYFKEFKAQSDIIFKNIKSLIKEYSDHLIKNSIESPIESVLEQRTAGGLS